MELLCLLSEWAIFRDMCRDFIWGKHLTIAYRGRNESFQNKKWWWWWCRIVNSICTSSSSSSYSFNVRDPKTHTVFQASALARVGPPVIFLQAQRSCAISSFIPIAFMSLLTQLLHVFLGAPLSTTPITFILVHFFTQLFSSFRSTCPNHLNLPLCILFSTHSMPKRFKSSSLRFLSFKDTPHILLTIILSALLNLARSSAFIAQVSLPYTNTLCTQASYIFPFSFKETPLFVSTGASSLNFPQADRTLVLEASSAPPPAHNISPR